MKKLEQQAFRFAHTDRWGNSYVFCPVCNEIRQLDGIRKHICTRARMGDSAHQEWLDHNPIGSSRAISFLGGDVHTLPPVYTAAHN